MARGALTALTTAYTVMAANQGPTRVRTRIPCASDPGWSPVRLFRTARHGGRTAIRSRRVRSTSGRSTEENAPLATPVAVFLRSPDRPGTAAYPPVPWNWSASSRNRKLKVVSEP